IYDLDHTNFVVGQPLGPGEYSDDGQRFVLKPVVRQASASFDDGEYFKSRRKSRGFGLFGFSSDHPSNSTVLRGHRDDQPSFISSLFSSDPQPVKKTLFKNVKAQAAADKTVKKKKLAKA